MNKASFKSKHYPTTTKRVWLIQKYAQKYYQIFALFIMITSLIMLLNHQSPLYFAIITASISILLSNFLGIMKMSALVAEIYFVEEQFYVLFVEDVLKGGQIPSFPIRFAHFSWNAQGATIHYHDRILQLNREDWEDWSVLANWFLPKEVDKLVFSYEYVEKSQPE
ncbi:MAG: hypothetical protein KatS3mg035_0874 [Bacteroidia bacterium]|nr:MAG: hypothetical protein KatS3mg035_0874 [Bacteroidia bacterium]